MASQIKKLKNDLQTMETELEKETVQGKENHGLVTTIVNGKGEIVDFQFKQGIVDKEFKLALITSINDGLKKAKNLQKEKKQKIAGNFPLPEMPDIF